MDELSHPDLFPNHPKKISYYNSQYILSDLNNEGVFVTLDKVKIWRNFSIDIPSLTKLTQTWIEKVSDTQLTNQMFCSLPWFPRFAAAGPICR